MKIKRNKTDKPKKETDFKRNERTDRKVSLDEIRGAAKKERTRPE